MYRAGPLNSKDAKANAVHNRNRTAAKTIHDLLFPKDD